MNQHQLKNVVVGFDLPFVLRLVDSIRKETTPQSYEQYMATVNGVPLMLRFEKKPRDLGGVRIATEDRRGLLNYSTVQIWFDKQFFSAIGLKENYKQYSDSFLAYALEGVNRFLELYRRATGSFWVRRIKPDEIPSIHMVGRLWDGADDGYIKGTLGTGLGLGSLISPEQDQLIRQGLASEWVPDELERLAYLVDALIDQQDFWIAALTVEVYFEAQFANQLRRAFVASGVPENEIDRRFETNEGFPRSITNLLKTYVRQLTGVVVDEPGSVVGQAYDKWATDSRNLRNEIAHGKRLTISRQQALAAVSAVRELMAHLDKIFQPLLGVGDGHQDA